MTEKIIPPCMHCGKAITEKAFKKSGGRRKFCSRECSVLHRPIAAAERATKECAGCGELFKAKSVEKTKYCSKACLVSSNKASPRHCKNCDSLFSPIRWQVSKGRYISDKSGNRDYCASECRAVDLKKNKEKSCIGCGVKFTPVRKASGGDYYVPYELPTTCGKECNKSAYPFTESRKQALSERMAGENHPNWQGGSHQLDFRGHEWPKIAEKARIRAGSRCEHCGKTEEENGRKLDVHHKIPFHQSLRKQEANKPSNLEALCKSCHQKADWKWRKENPIQYVIGFS